MKKGFIGLLFVLIAMYGFCDTEVYVTVYSSFGGQIDGEEIPVEQSLGKYIVCGFAHEITSPRDESSGLPTGKRQHKPFTIIKELDALSPILMNFYVKNMLIPKIIIEVIPKRDKIESTRYTIKLTEATIAGIRHEMLENKYERNMEHKEREHVMLCYQKISWLHNDSGESSEDDWASPNV